jgi:hypothetical protein
MITKGWVWQMKLVQVVNCNIITQYGENNSYFELFKNETLLINFVSLLYHRCQINSYYLVSSVHMLLQTTLLAGLCRNKFWGVGNDNRMYITRKHEDHRLLQFLENNSVLFFSPSGLAFQEAAMLDS